MMVQAPITSDRTRLKVIAHAVDKIGEHVTTRAAFDADEMVQVRCKAHLRTIGVAASALSPILRERHAEVQWDDLTRLGDDLITTYYDDHTERVWHAVQSELKSLRATVTRMLREADASHV